MQGEDDLCEPFFAYNRAKGTLYDGETRLFLRGTRTFLTYYSFLSLAMNKLKIPISNRRDIKFMEEFPP